MSRRPLAYFPITTKVNAVKAKGSARMTSITSSARGLPKLIVDPESLGLIDGTEVDFVKDGLNEAFKFRNPNVKGECGCGESFTV